MNPAPQSIRRRLVIRIGMLVTAVLIISGMIFAAVSYHLLSSETNRTLRKATAALAAVFDAQDRTQSMSRYDIEQIVNQQVVAQSIQLRITYVLADGQVRYDNVEDPALMANHSQRPEIQQAQETGVGQSTRYSSTLRQESRYYAMKLANGDTLRLSRSQQSLLGVMFQALPALTLLIIILAVISWLIGSAIARSVTSSIGSIDLDDPLSHPVETELEPLTHRLATQQEQIALQQQERQEFTANASHELKTPLTVISGSAELISSGLAEPEDIPRFAQQITQQVATMRVIINDMLTLSRYDEKQVMHSTEVDIADIVRGVTANLQSAARAKQIRLLSTTQKALVTGDPAMLTYLVRNLVDNAIRYNREGGVVSVEAYSQGSYTILRVVDTGKGIPRDQRENIFKRFYRIDSSSEAPSGSGLGLAIVRHVVQAHKGTISVEDNKPMGTVFTVRLSARQQSTPFDLDNVEQKS
ncbi:sensor histidine kinase [Alloscardovia criceti]|uniref:sensor histidine kinase n=1 Tax=Alloscardovia criceti TaxID=356828 RepID=UPI000381ABA0|nr:ATP-binding protein [Alloscardovia criceti]